MKARHLRSGRWTRGEITLWLAALIVAVILGLLVVIDVLGSWALIVVGLIAIAVGLLRYRAENEIHSGSAGRHGE